MNKFIIEKFYYNAEKIDNSFFNIEIVTLLISIVAIVISIAAIKNDKKCNELNLKAIFYNKIFDDFLLEKIPEAILGVEYKDGKFKDSKNLDDAIVSLSEKIIYFKYRELEFYNKLNRLICSIDDLLVQFDEIDMGQEDYTRIKNELEGHIKELYTMVENCYVGKK